MLPIALFHVASDLDSGIFMAQVDHLMHCLNKHLYLYMCNVYNMHIN